MLPLDSVTALDMVVAELVTNSFRLAFPDKDGTIVVTLVRGADGTGACLTIEDDGVGFVPVAESSRRGVGLVRRLMEQIGGTLELNSLAGTLWTLSFPVAPMEVKVPALI